VRDLDLSEPIAADGVLDVRPVRMGLVARDDRGMPRRGGRGKRQALFVLDRVSAAAFERR